MGRLSARSNPTGLKELNKSCVGISVLDVAGSRSFILEKLDLKGTGLSEHLRVFVVARAGSTSSRHDMGVVSNWNKESCTIDELDRSHPLRFRLLIHENENPKLVASIENLRARDDSQSESLLPMEPAELGERVWKLVINEDGPILQFNSKVFPSAAGAENYIPFGALVLPEALRQIMEKISEQPQCLEDEDDPWHIWAKWLNSIGAELPSHEFEDDEKAQWCGFVVDKFCERFQFSSRLKAMLLESEK